MRKTITKAYLIKQTDTAKYLCQFVTLIFIFFVSLFEFAFSINGIKGLIGPLSLKSIVAILICTLCIFLLPITNTIKSLKIQYIIFAGEYKVDTVKLTKTDSENESDLYQLHFSNDDKILVSKEDYSFYLNKEGSQFIVYTIGNRKIYFDSDDFCVTENEKK